MADQMSAPPAPPVCRLFCIIGCFCSSEPRANVDPRPETVHANFTSCLRRQWDALSGCPVGTFTLGIE